MDIDNPQVTRLLSELRVQLPPALHAKYDNLSVFYEKKLWHQLTVTCEELFADSSVPRPVLIALFRDFVEKWAKRMNPLAYTKLAVHVAELLEGKEALALLEGLGARMQKENLTETVSLAYILVRIETAQYYLGGSEAAVNTARDYIDECIELVESMAVSPPAAIQASVYRISALYDKHSLNYSAFYRHTLLFLACLPSDLTGALSAAKQVEIAHDLCVAALLSDGIYNFGELLAHPILAVLVDTKFAHLVHLLEAFNAGQLAAFVSEAAPLFQAVKAHPALATHVSFLQEKLCLMSLAQLLFVQIRNDRRIPFSVISAATNVPLDQVEFLLIRAMSCAIIRGVIDQIDGSVTVTWIQPRVLVKTQIADLLAAVETWNDKVSETLQMVHQLRSSGALTESVSVL